MESSDKAMKAYYRRRAPVYDEVYEYPERQADLRYLESYVASFFENKRVLEIAAGTGYWTQFIAKGATSVLATDATDQASAQIKQRPNTESVSVKNIDAYALEEIKQTFNAAFAGLWVSHVPKQDLADFIQLLNGRLEAGASVLFIDNSREQCVRLPITYTDDKGNTYQNRKLADGTAHRVLKNFPTEAELLAATKDVSSDHEYLQLENFWLFKYRISSP